MIFTVVITSDKSGLWVEVARFEPGGEGEWRGIACLNVILSPALMNSPKLSRVVPTLLLAYDPGFLQLVVI